MPLKKNKPIYNKHLSRHSGGQDSARPLIEITFHHGTSCTSPCVSIACISHHRVWHRIGLVRPFICLPKVRSVEGPVSRIMETTQAVVSESMSEPHWQHVGTTQFARSELRSSQEAFLGTPVRHTLIPLRLPRISLKPPPIHLAGAGPASRYKASLDPASECCFRCHRALRYWPNYLTIQFYREVSFSLERFGI